VVVLQHCTHVITKSKGIVAIIALIIDILIIYFMSKFDQVLVRLYRNVNEVEHKVSATFFDYVNHENIFAHFKDCTVISSIHRLHLLSKFDTVVVIMAQGKVVQT
jgi:hypothetical protein